MLCYVRVCVYLNIYKIKIQNDWFGFFVCELHPMRIYEYKCVYVWVCFAHSNIIGLKIPEKFYRITAYQNTVHALHTHTTTIVRKSNEGIKKIKFSFGVFDFTLIVFEPLHNFVMCAQKCNQLTMNLSFFFFDSNILCMYTYVDNSYKVWWKNHLNLVEFSSKFLGWFSFTFDTYKVYIYINAVNDLSVEFS